MKCDDCGTVSAKCVHVGNLLICEACLMGWGFVKQEAPNGKIVPLPDVSLQLPTSIKPDDFNQPPEAA